MPTTPDVGPIPAGGILLHVGMPKTGTSTLQGMLAAAAGELPAQDVLYPQTSGGAHHRAARAVLQSALMKGEAPPDFAEWTSLVETVRSASATRIVLSSEVLSAAKDDDCRRIADDLGADRLHVVIGVRPFASLAVSMWQQTLKRGRRSTLEEWLEKNFRRTEERPSTVFWRRHDPSVVAERWVKLLGPDRVHVVVVDGRDHGFLPATSERLLALAPGTLSSAEVGYTNRGMTAVESEVVRRLNASIRLPGPEYREFVRDGAIRHFLAQRVPPPSEPRPTPPAWVAEHAVREGRRVAEAITASGVHVIGDLDALTRPGSAVEPAQSNPTANAPIDLAVEALVGTVRASVVALRDADRLAKKQRRRSRQPDVRELPASELAGALARRVKAKVRPRR